MRDSTRTKKTMAWRKLETPGKRLARKKREFEMKWALRRKRLQPTDADLIRRQEEIRADSRRNSALRTDLTIVRELHANDAEPLPEPMVGVDLMDILVQRFKPPAQVSHDEFQRAVHKLQEAKHAIPDFELR